jgi:multimeric flavodoxin WrbA
MSDLEESDMALNALFLNCTLKKSPEISNTSVLIGESRKIFEKEGVETEEIRVVDYHVPYGIAHRVGNDDEWPEIFEKIMRAQILVIGTAIWLGEKTSVASKAVERMYGSSGETNDLGQYIYYNKVGGVLATGNEDGGKEVSRSILYALQHIGYIIPPQADAYWVGEAGPGPSYIDAGTENEFTKRNTRFMTYNLLHLARMIEATPIPAIGNVREEKRPEREPCRR